MAADFRHAASVATTPVIVKDEENISSKLYRHEDAEVNTTSDISDVVDDEDDDEDDEEEVIDIMGDTQSFECAR